MEVELKNIYNQMVFNRLRYLCFFSDFFQFNRFPHILLDNKQDVAIFIPMKFVHKHTNPGQNDKRRQFKNRWNR